MNDNSLIVKLAIETDEIYRSGVGTLNRYAIFAGAAMAASLCWGAAAAETVTIAHGSKQIEITHPGLYVPTALGWPTQEGIEVSVQTTTGSQQALQLLAAGQVQFITVNPETIVNARDQGVNAKMIYPTVTRHAAQIAVLKDGPVKQFTDIKGSQIGVLSLGAGGVPYFKAVMRENGLNPETDVTMVPTGAGAPAMQALLDGTVSALSLWAGAFAVYENEGVKLRIFKSEALGRAPGFVLATTDEYLASNPETVAKIGKMMAKASVFAIAKPQAAIEAYWAALPQNKPAEINDKVIADNLHVLNVGLRDMTVDHRDDKRFGWNDAQGIEALQQYLVKNGVRATKVPEADLFSNELVDQYNDFDAAEVKAAAEAYKP